MVNFGPNVVTVLVTLLERRDYVVRAYGTLNDVPELHQVKQGLAVAPKGAEIILMGDFNRRLQEPGYKREEEVVMALKNHDMEDMTCHFTPWQQYRGGRRLT